MKIYGKVHRLQDNINTDLIIPVKRKRDSLNDNELAKYLLEEVDPDLYSRISPGDFLVAGRNFGCGASREVAPRVIQAAGIKAVIAKSFARIFFRNAINIGLMLIECDTDGIEDGHSLELDLDTYMVHDIDSNYQVMGSPLPTIMTDILNSGGLVKYLKENGDFKL